MKALLGVMRGIVLGCSITAMVYSTKGDAAEAEKWRSLMISSGVLYLVMKPSDK